MTCRSQIEFFGIRVGDVVREPGGRHEGVVLAAFNWTCRVRWECGWREDLPLDAVGGGREGAAVPRPAAGHQAGHRGQVAAAAAGGGAPMIVLKMSYGTVVMYGQFTGWPSFSVMLVPGESS
jgi:hypothetical protein